MISNIIVYANETDGKEAGTLCAHEDPDGAMHYYFGYENKMKNFLYLKVNGEPNELKIDYGESTNQKKYSPFHGKELKEMHQ